MNLEYIACLLILCVLYALSIFLMKYARKPKTFNLVFMALVFVPYVILCIIIYLDVGFYDWNFQNALPTANVSPFMFSIIPIILILPQAAKEHIFLLISLLSVGMFMSSVLGCLYNALIDYKFHFHFMLDYVSHFSLSLFGIYLIRTRQVTLAKKSCAISSLIIVGSATLMLILNLIFDTAFFGLSLRGKHNIYNNVIVDNSYLSALIYYVGLVFVLLLGYFVCKFFVSDRFVIPKEETDNTKTTIQLIKR